MSNPASQSQIGVNGTSRYYGIPALAVQWLANDGATQNVAAVFGSVDKTSGAKVQVGTDNANEIATMNRSQRTRTVKFSAKAQAATSAAAEALATNGIPQQMDLVSIGHMTSGSFVGGTISGSTVTQASGLIDQQIETPCAVVEAASARWSPEGELVIDFTLTVHYNPDGTLKALVAAS